MLYETGNFGPYEAITFRRVWSANSEAPTRRTPGPAVDGEAAGSGLAGC